MAEISEVEIRSWLNQQHSRMFEHHRILRVRRALINRDASYEPGATGTHIPPPFDKSSLVIRTMIGAPMEAAQHYVSRIAGNRPDIAVAPLSTKMEITDTVARLAGEQERLAAELWNEAGGAEAQNACAWAMTRDGVGYYLTLPRDAGFGLPDRMYVDDSDEAQTLVKAGKLSPEPRKTPSGKMIYAESGDVWAARRDQSARNRPVAGDSLFTLKAYPRDMVLRERDIDGIRIAAVIEEIAGDKVGPGSEIALSAAKRDLIHPDAMKDYRLLQGADGKIIGGIPQGTPVETNGAVLAAYTLTRIFTRTEQIVMIGAPGSVGGWNGGKVVYRGEHGARIQGKAVCPVVEVPFMRTDTEVPGQEFATPLSQVMGYVPLINQLLTLRSNATAYDLIPRWVIELKDGSLLRAADGEPDIVTSEATPGLDPTQAAAYDGTLRQLTIETEGSDRLIEMYFQKLSEAMPSSASQGEGGTSEAAWHAHQMIEQSQQVLREPVDNHALAVKQIEQMWYGWLRTLDVPVYFYAAPGQRSKDREIRGLIEFKPEDLTDSIIVTQQLDSPGDAVIRIQIGMQLRQAGAVDDETFFAEYMRVPDSRQAVKDMYKQQVVSHVMGGIPAPPGSIIANVADAVRGQTNFQMLQMFPNFAIATAEQMVAQAQATAQPGQPGAEDGQAPNNGPMGGPGTGDGGAHGSHPNVAGAAGVRVPGMGSASTLQQQLGPRVQPPVAAR